MRTVSKAQSAPSLAAVSRIILGAIVAVAVVEILVILAQHLSTQINEHFIHIRYKVVSRTLQSKTRLAHILLRVLALAS